MQILRQFSALLFVRAMVLVFNFGVGVLLARWLGPEGKGVLAVLLSSAALLALVLGFGLPTASLFLHKQGRYGIAQLVLSALVFWGVLLVLAVLAFFFFREIFASLLLSELSGLRIEGIWLWLMLGMLPGLLVSSLLSVLLVIDGHGRAFVTWHLASQLVGIALVLLLVGWLGMGVTGALLAQVVVQNIALLVAGLWLVRLARHERLAISWAGLRAMLPVGGQQYLVSLLANIFKRAEIFLLAALIDLRAVGLFAVAMSFYDLVIDIPRSMVVPIAGRVADRSSVDREAQMGLTMRLQTIAAALLTVGAALVLPPLIPVIYGQEFSLTGSVLLLLLPGVLFRTLHLGTSSYFAGVGRPATLLPALAAATVVNLALDFYLIPRVGIHGAALASVAGELVLAIASLALFVRAVGGRWADVLIVRPADLQLVRNALPPLRGNLR